MERCKECENQVRKGRTKVTMKKRRIAIAIGMLMMGFFGIQIMQPVEAAEHVTKQSYEAETIEGAGVILKEAICKREAECVIGFGKKLSSKDIKDIYEEACKHDPRDPKGGDYLDIQMKKVVLPNTYAYISGQKYMYRYQMQYYNSKQQEEEVDQLLEQALLKWNLQNMTEYEKVNCIYRNICENVAYDFEGSTGDLKYTAYGALANKKAVCSGYAALLYRACLSVGIDCRIVKGSLSNGEKHAWNLVKIGQDYFALDSTLDAVDQTNIHFLDCDITFSDVQGRIRHIPETTFSNVTPHVIKEKTVPKTLISNGKKIRYCEKCHRTLKEEKIYYLPKNTTIKKLSSKKRKVVITLNRQTKPVEGYEIQYARQSTFHNGKVIRLKGVNFSKKTIKGLKSKKKYYFRVRTYRMEDSQRIYSEWSKKKSIKIK